MSNLKSFKFLPYAMLLAVMLFLGGCAGSVKHMQGVQGNSIKTSPSNGKSMVIFLRPSSMGFGVQSSVFEIRGSKPYLVGIVAAKKKVAYEVNPGKHTFMVVSESGDFMTANLLPNKTYYALVTPRMGAWKARFSLKAVHSNEVNSAQFNKWLNECKWVRKTSDSMAWANENSASIQSKFSGNYSKWLSKPVNKRPNLLPQDGK
jgi:asparagine N-glycosylation enzyme membrane subunit Stt3